MQATRRPPVGVLAYAAFVKHLKTTQPDAFEGLTKEADRLIIAKGIRANDMAAYNAFVAEFIEKNSNGGQQEEEKKPSIPIVKKKPSIPTHIMTSHIELAILKNDDCPISLSPLTKGTVAYTPCGHLFNYESLCESFKSTQLKSCPTCRAPMTQANITKFI